MLVRNSVRHAFTLVLLVLFMPDQHQSVKRMRGVFYGSIAVFAAGSCSIAFSDLIKLVCIHAETFLMDSLCSGCLVESFHPTDHITISLFHIQGVQAPDLMHTLGRPRIVNLWSIELEVARSIRRSMEMLMNNVTDKSLSRGEVRT